MRSAGLLVALLLAGPGATGAAVPEATRQDPAALLEEGQSLTRAARFEEARERLEAARRGFAAREDRRGELEATISLGDLARDSGAPGRAVEILERALALARDLEDLLLEGHALRQLGQARAFAGDLPGALADLERAAEIFRLEQVPLELGHLAAVRSVVASQHELYEEAVRWGQRALELLPGRDKEAALLGALSAVAYGRERLGDTEGALEAYGLLIERAWERNDQRLIRFAYCNRAGLLRKQGEVRTPEEDLRRAISGFERGRSSILGDPDRRARYLARQVAAYDRLIELLVDTYRGVEAFDVAERFHGRSFLEMLDEGSLARLAADGSPLRASERELVREMGSTRLELEAAPGARELEERLGALDRELASLRARIRREDPAWTRLVDPSPPTLASVQEALRKGEALVAYWVSEERILAWTVTADEAELTRIPISRHELRQAVDAYLEPLRFRRRAEDLALAGGDEGHLELGLRLHRWLVGSLPETVAEADTLLIVPDDALHHLPFEALATGCRPPGEAASARVHDAYSHCRYLGLEKATRYAPSAGVFLALLRAPQTDGEEPRGLLALAPFLADSRAGVDRSLDRGLLPPLTHASEEVRTLAAVVPGARLRLGSEASEGRFKREAGGYRYLHLATHGLISDRLPMTSGVLLAPEDGEDGLLQAHEVLGMELAADVVTLSACRTGRGELSRGEGIVGLSRTFLHAGAGGVVASLWDVDDRSTSLFMEAFYGALARGTEPAQALLEARREVFRRGTTVRLVFRERPMTYSHPRFWAPFLLVGGR